MATNATIPVTLSQAWTETVSVSYATRNGTATSGSDYTARSGTITFAPGETTKSITVPILDGADPGIFYVDLTDPDGATIAVAVSTVTLVRVSSLLPTVMQMLGAHWGYIQRATGAAASAAGMPPMVTAEGLVKNNQHPEVVLGGYLPDGAASSEGISLLLRGVVQGYSATGDTAYLAYAKFLFEAAITYFFDGQRPSASADQDWYHNWLVNAGVPFNIRGPLNATNGSAVQGGHIGVAVSFTNGVGQLSGTPPDVIYEVATNGSQFVWENVLSALIPGTGSFVDVDYYINAQSQKVYGTQREGSFGQPIEPGSNETPGKIVLTEPLNGTYLVNYCVSVPGQQIQYGETYEGWPFWRRMSPNEFCHAADAIHWFVDAFRMLRRLEPSNSEWARAHDRMLAVWQTCCNMESADTRIFRAGVKGEYNKDPLAYAYAYGLESDGTTVWQSIPPTTRYTAQRTSDGYVTFALPLNDGDERPLRYGFTFECQGLFLTYGAGASISADVKVSAETPLLYRFRSTADDPNTEYQATYLHAANGGVATFPIQSFARFSGGSVWTPDRAGFTWNAGQVTQSKAMATLSNGGVAMVLNLAMAGGYNGWGIDRTNVYPYAEWTSPPCIAYRTTATDVIYALKDAAGWQWRTILPAQSTLAPRTFTWADFEVVPGSGGGAEPSSPAPGVILGVQVQAQENAASIAIAYISAAAPTYATSGDIALFNITYAGTGAQTLKIGDVQLAGGGRRTINHYGSLPFGFQIGGPGRTALSTAPYRGPYIAGYQSGTPWVDLNEASKLNAMLDFMLEAQNQFSQRHPSGLMGPWMHCYLPATWDAGQIGSLDTWVWDAPDGNPAWSGWQFRAFDAMGHTYALAVEAGMTGPAAKAATTCNRFLNWLADWLEANPSAMWLPYSWGPPGWSMGRPMPPSSYLDPQLGGPAEPHDIALAMKGAIFCAKAGSDLGTCRAVIRRCVAMLKALQATGTADPMRGCFTTDAAAFKAYGFAQGEIHDALALAAQNPDFLKD